MAAAARPPILVVDDNRDNTEIIQRYLAVRGYPITVAHDGDEALALFEQVRPALVLLDVMMPKMNGLDVAAALRSDEVTEAIPIIMLSAKAQASDVQAGLDLGVDDYVTKPFDPLELLERVGALLDRPEVVVKSMSEEHGILDLRDTQWRPEVGEQVRVVPNHVCIVVHLNDEVAGVEGDRVVERWTVDARGR